VKSSTHPVKKIPRRKKLSRPPASRDRANKLALENSIRAKTTELLAANVDLRKEIARCKDLEREVLSVIDRAQLRLGQELHDGLCQHLTAVAFMARALAGRLRNAKRIEPREIENLAELINDSVSEARALARGFHPVEVDAAGLVSALQNLVKKRQWAIPVRYRKNGGVPIKDDTIALHLYRIASEAILNANKHSRAREVILRVDVLPKEIVLSVTDDGVGMSPRARKGMGMHIMDYRARTIGAKLEVEHLKPKGTRVICRLPRP
jgi:signal transduction histidine kinase